MMTYDKYSNNYIDSRRYVMLLKIMEALGIDRLEYNKNGDFYYTHNHSIHVNCYRATAKPLNDTEFTYIIKSPEAFEN